MLSEQERASLLNSLTDEEAEDETGDEAQSEDEDDDSDIFDERTESQSPNDFGGGGTDGPEEEKLQM